VGEVGLHLICSAARTWFPLIFLDRDVRQVRDRAAPPAMPLL
jgi:hypothetical protein